MKTVWIQLPLGLLVAGTMSVALADDLNLKPMGPSHTLSETVTTTTTSEEVTQTASPIGPQGDLKLRVSAVGRDPRFMARKYLLGPNDVISLHLVGAQNIGGDNLKVQPDGHLIMDLIGPLDVTGMSMDDLYYTLLSKYRYYYKDPKLSLGLVSTKPFLVYVSGAVLRPGSFELGTNVITRNVIQPDTPENSLTRFTPLVSNIVTAAGGLQPNADYANVQVTNALTHEAFTVNLQSILKGQAGSATIGDALTDLYLVQGDTVNVPERTISQPFNDEEYKLLSGSTLAPERVPVKVFGYVNNQGLVSLNSQQSLTLMSAITAAGGYLQGSPYSPHRVYVSRPDMITGKLTTIELDPRETDMALMPNDIVYVPQKLRPRIGQVADYMTRLTLPFFYGFTTYRSATGDTFFRDRQNTGSVNTIIPVP